VRLKGSRAHPQRGHSFSMYDAIPMQKCMAGLLRSPGSGSGSDAQEAGSVEATVEVDGAPAPQWQVQLQLLAGGSIAAVATAPPSEMCDEVPLPCCFSQPTSSCGLQGHTHVSTHPRCHCHIQRVASETDPALVLVNLRNCVQIIRHTFHNSNHANTMVHSLHTPRFEVKHVEELLPDAVSSSEAH
jgi:hypothetical protein